jgi:hypothetical protein
VEEFGFEAIETLAHGAVDHVATNAHAQATE